MSNLTLCASIIVECPMKKDYLKYNINEEIHYIKKGAGGEGR